MLERKSQILIESDKATEEQLMSVMLWKLARTTCATRMATTGKCLLRSRKP